MKKLLSIFMVALLMLPRLSAGACPVVEDVSEKDFLDGLKSEAYVNKLDYVQTKNDKGLMPKHVSICKLPDGGEIRVYKNDELGALAKHFENLENLTKSKIETHEKISKTADNMFWPTAAAGVALMCYGAYDLYKAAMREENSEPKIDDMAKKINEKTANEKNAKDSKKLTNLSNDINIYNDEYKKGRIAVQTGYAVATLSPILKVCAVLPIAYNTFSDIIYQKYDYCEVKKGFESLNKKYGSNEKFYCYIKINNEGIICAYGDIYSRIDCPINGYGGCGGCPPEFVSLLLSRSGIKFYN